jgi:uncharacterized protein (TIGR02217 family)
MAFYRFMEGRRFAFKYRDHLDWTSTLAYQEEARRPPLISSTDQHIGVGNGTNTIFQLQKTYPPVQGAGEGKVRPIYKPIPGTVKVAVWNGVSAWTTLVEGVGFTVDYIRGKITTITPPPNGREVRAGYHFWVACKFNNKRLPVSLEEYGVGGAADVKLLEQRLPEALDT